MVVTKLRWPSPSKREGWSNQETAEFFRISHFMEQAGLSVELEKGVTDEGDPWLVFIRRDTGDVIAHFARINGRFISVSSVTDSIFEGPNVRSVVDQMLNRHPLMIPSSGSKGKLFLHPGVVLSAFVAAAYFMATDATRADNIEKVLSGVLHAQDRDLTRDEMVLGRMADPVGATSRKGVIRTPTFEDSGVFPQMEALGAVLRLKEIFAEDDSVTLANSVTEDEVFSDDYVLSAVLDFDLLPFIIRGSLFNEEFGNYEVNFIASSDEVKSQEDQAESQLVLQKDVLNWIGSSTEEFQSMSSQGSYFLMASLSDVVSARDTWGLDASEGAVVKGLQQTKNLKTEAVAEEVKSPSQVFDFQALANDVKEMFDIVRQDTLVDGSTTAESLGVAVTEGGKVAVLAISPGLEKHENVSANVIVVEGEFDGLTSLEIPPDQITNDVINLDNGPTPSDEMPLAIVNKNFLVHQIKTEGKAELALTDATDIIFYWGGDLRVTNFELGKDLVWFLFSPDKLEQNHAETVLEADVQLNFGMDNNLTFVDLIGVTSSTDIV